MKVRRVQGRHADTTPTEELGQASQRSSRVFPPKTLMRDS